MPRKPRRLKLVENAPRLHPPDLSHPLVRVECLLLHAVEATEGESYYLVKIRDALVGDEPEWRLDLPKDRRRWPAPQAVANAGAGQLNEGAGYVFLARHVDGVPDFQAAYASSGRQVLCLWTTDPALARVEHPAVRWGPRWREFVSGFVRCGQEMRSFWPPSAS